MIRSSQRTDHPAVSYAIGLAVILVMGLVLAGMFYHFAFSSHGPGFLAPPETQLPHAPPSEFEAAPRHPDAEIHDHFHQFADYPKIKDALRPVCHRCHSDLPHTKNKQIRAMLNIHSEFFECEACHLKNETNRPVVYQWYNPIEKNPKGPFLGTAYDPETGALTAVTDHFSRIIPYFKTDEGLVSGLEMEGSPAAEAYLNRAQQIPPEKRLEATKEFHVHTLTKGPECHTCHSANSILDFKKLGFSPKRRTDLEYMNIVGLITKYNEFYLPDLFKPVPMPEAETKMIKQEQR